jgi:hypothetical protein
MPTARPAPPRSNGFDAFQCFDLLALFRFEGLYDGLSYLLTLWKTQFIILEPVQKGLDDFALVLAKFQVCF